MRVGDAWPTYFGLTSSLSAPGKPGALSVAWLTGPHPLHRAWRDIGDLLADAHRVLAG